MKQKIISMLMVMVFTCVDITAFAHEFSPLELGSIIANENVQEERMLESFEDERVEETTEILVEENREILTEEEANEISSEEVIDELMETQWTTEETIVDDKAMIVDSGVCGEALSWTLLETGELIINGTGKMTDYADIDSDGVSNSPWMTYRAQIYKLTLEQGITHVGDSAFKGCFELTGDLRLPDSITSIGNNAFERCDKLMGDLIMPLNLKSIGNDAFLYCRNFNGKLELNKELETIGQSAFHHCSGLIGDLTIPDSVFDIGEYAFSDCESMDGKLTLSENLTEIKKESFSYCGALTGDLVIPNKVNTIGTFAFYSCSSMTGHAYVSENVTNIERNALSTITTIHGKTDSYAETYAQNNGIAFVVNGTELNDKIEFNGHYYQSFDIDMTWKEAKEYCESIGGYLVTVTSKEENDLVYSISLEVNGLDCWLGATDEEEEGVWKWVTGETWDYTKWDEKQPDDIGDGEDYLHMWKQGTWNDNDNDNVNELGNDAASGFVCEWGDVDEVSVTIDKNATAQDVLS